MNNGHHRFKSNLSGSKKISDFKTSKSFKQPNWTNDKLLKVTIVKTIFILVQSQYKHYREWEIDCKRQESILTIFDCVLTGPMPLNSPKNHVPGVICIEKRIHVEQFSDDSKYYISYFYKQKPFQKTCSFVNLSHIFFCIG